MAVRTALSFLVLMLLQGAAGQTAAQQTATRAQDVAPAEARRPQVLNRPRAPAEPREPRCESGGSNLQFCCRGEMPSRHSVAIRIDAALRCRLLSLQAFLRLYLGLRGLLTGSLCSCAQLLSYFFSRASIPAWAMASSTSDLAPLAAIAPSVWPSTLMGKPPCPGKQR